MQLAWSYVLHTLDGCRARVRLAAELSGEWSLDGEVRLSGNQTYLMTDLAPRPSWQGRRISGGIAVFSPRGVLKGTAMLVHRADRQWELQLSGAVDLVQRRAHFRLPVRCPVTLAAAAGPEAEATLVDISLAGGRVETQAPVAEGDLVRVRLPGAGGGALQLPGQVRSVLRGEDGSRSAGLQWAGLGPGEREELKQIVLAALAKRWPAPPDQPAAAGDPLVRRAEHARELLGELVQLLFQHSGNPGSDYMYSLMRLSAEVVQDVNAVIIEALRQRAGGAEAARE